MGFDNWFRGPNRNRQKDDENVEFYEDTHDEYGNYVGKQAPPSRARGFSPASSAAAAPAQEPVSGVKPAYGNIVVYRPATPEEVEKVINFLKRGEPAVVNLNELDDAASQRILDFLSGAIFALSGNIHRVTGNIFLLSPSGVEIQSS